MPKPPVALVFWPYNPVPCFSGAHNVELADLISFQRLGYQVVAFGTDLCSDNPWNEAALATLKQQHGVEARVYPGGPVDRLYTKHTQRQDASNWDRYTPPWLRRSFQAAVAELEPELVVVNYAWWAGLLEGVPATTGRVLRELDIMTWNQNLLARATRVIPTPADVRKCPPEALAEDFFAGCLDDANGGLTKEATVCDQFQAVATLTAGDERVLQPVVGQATVQHVPFARSVKDLGNTYQGAPMFVISNYVLNLQAYLYFAARVLPRILAKDRGFRLQVIGKACANVVSVPGLELLGFQNDLEALYQQAPFAACPLIGGTGLQIKVVEAMSYGVPVLALRNIAAASPIQHGVNGLIASTAAEYAEYALQLTRDRRLCARLGQAARETIRQQFSPELQAQQWRRLLDTAKSERPAASAAPAVVNVVNRLGTALQPSATTAPLTAPTDPSALLAQLLAADDFEVWLRTHARLVTRDFVAYVHAAGQEAAHQGEAEGANSLRLLAQHLKNLLASRSPARPAAAGRVLSSTGYALASL